MVDDKWRAVALPLLEAIADQEADRGLVSIGTMAEQIGVTPRAAGVELERLIAGGYVAGKVTKTFSGPEGVSIVDPRLLERGARAVGVWPLDDPYAELLRMLQAELDDPDVAPERKSAVRRFREAAVEMGRDVGKDVLVALIKAQAGL